jgi:hypothetical protein
VDARRRPTAHGVYQKQKEKGQEADINIELEGKQYNVCVKPIEDDDFDDCD